MPMDMDNIDDYIEKCDAIGCSTLSQGGSCMQCHKDYLISKGEVDKEAELHQVKLNL